MMTDVHAPPALRLRVLIAGIAPRPVLGLLAGGRLTNLAESSSAGSRCSLAAVIVRFGTEVLLNADVPIVETLRLPAARDRLRRCCSSASG